MRLTTCVVAVFALSACGEGDTTAGDTQVSTSSTSTSALAPIESTAPTAGSTELVTERRAMTDAERERLDRTEPPPLDCDDVGEAFWDYDGSTEPGTPGRTADDALVEMINDFNAEARSDPRTTLDYDYVPSTGWIELTDGDSSTFVHTTGNWRFALTISGDPSLSNWRPSGALLCQPEAGGLPPNP